MKKGENRKCKTEIKVCRLQKAKQSELMNMSLFTAIKTVLGIKSNQI